MLRASILMNDLPLRHVSQLHNLTYQTQYLSLFVVRIIIYFFSIGFAVLALLLFYVLNYSYLNISEASYNSDHTSQFSAMTKTNFVTKTLYQTLTPFPLALLLIIFGQLTSTKAGPNRTFKARFGTTVGSSVAAGAIAFILSNQNTLK